jgi:hypothetical protein
MEVKTMVHNKNIKMPCKNCGKETLGKQQAWHLKYKLNFCNWNCVSKFLEDFYYRFIRIDKRITMLEKEVLPEFKKLQKLRSVR